MGDNIIPFPQPEFSYGNGAYAKVKEYLDGNFYGGYVSHRIESSLNGRDGAGLDHTDHFLAWLWQEGYAVVTLKQASLE